jgi:hypothetical protein
MRPAQATAQDRVLHGVNVSGKFSNPQTSTVETILGIIQNAFFEAILPGFERQSRPHGNPSVSQVSTMGAFLSLPPFPSL